jgi:hypothetical protein
MRPSPPRGDADAVPGLSRPGTARCNAIANTTHLHTERSPSLRRAASADEEHALAGHGQALARSRCVTRRSSERRPSRGRAGACGSCAPALGRGVCERRSGIEGHVVVEELTEEGRPRRLARVVRVVGAQRAVDDERPGPASSGSAASSRPTGRPSSRSAASTSGVCCANGASRNIRPRWSALTNDDAWEQGGCPGYAMTLAGSMPRRPRLHPRQRATACAEPVLVVPRSSLR